MSPAHLWIDRLKQSEINFRIAHFFDEGYVFELGDELNGIRATAYTDDFSEGLRQLCLEAYRHYPASQFAQEFLGHVRLYWTPAQLKEVGIPAP